MQKLLICFGRGIAFLFALANDETFSLPSTRRKKVSNQSLAQMAHFIREPVARLKLALGITQDLMESCDCA